MQATESLQTSSAWIEFDWNQFHLKPTPALLESVIEADHVRYSFLANHCVDFWKFVRVSSSKEFLPWFRIVYTISPNFGDTLLHFLSTVEGIYIVFCFFLTDTIYFHLPSLDGEQKTIYGVSCYRQMDAKVVPQSYYLKNRTHLYRVYLIWKSCIVQQKIDQHTPRFPHAYDSCVVCIPHACLIIVFPFLLCWT